MIYSVLNFVVSLFALAFLAWMLGSIVRDRKYPAPFNVVVPFSLYFICGALAIYMFIGAVGEYRILEWLK